VTHFLFQQWQGGFICRPLAYMALAAALGLWAFPPILLLRLLPYVHFSLNESCCGRPQTPTGPVIEVERLHLSIPNDLNSLIRLLSNSHMVKSKEIWHIPVPLGRAIWKLLGRWRLSLYLKVGRWMNGYSLNQRIHDIPPPTDCGSKSPLMPFCLPCRSSQNQQKVPPRHLHMLSCRWEQPTISRGFVLDWSCGISL